MIRPANCIQTHLTLTSMLDDDVEYGNDCSINAGDIDDCNSYFMFSY